MKENTGKNLRAGVIGVLLASSAFFSGCAVTPAPKEELAVAQAAINDAVRSGAQQYAPAELKTAQDKLERAREASQDKEQVQARRLAEEAQLDARVAEAIASAERAQQGAKQVQQSLDVLRQELKLDNNPASNQGG